MIVKVNEEMNKRYTDMMKDIDKNKLLSGVKLRIVNSDYENLEVLVHQPWMGMEIIFTYELDEIATIKVTKELLASFEIDFEEMFRRATQNVMDDGFIVSPIENMLGGVGAAGVGFSTLYVVTNKKKQYGANALLCKKDIVDLLKRVNKNAFIIPSSKHEVLVFIDNGEDTENQAAYIKSITKTINNTVVSKGDFLSNDVFYMTKNGYLEFA